MDTSQETYLRGEIGTFSDRTIKLYARMIREDGRKGENLTEKNLGFMVRFYGYQSLEEAEQMQK